MPVAPRKRVEEFVMTIFEMSVFEMSMFEIAKRLHLFGRRGLPVIRRDKLLIMADNLPISFGLGCRTTGIKILRRSECTREREGEIH